MGSLGGWKAGAMLVMSLLGYVIQSQLAQHVQGDLQFRQPLFLFYFAHSSFVIIFPIQINALSWITGIPRRRYILGLKDAISTRILNVTHTGPFPTKRFAMILLPLTVGITLPGLMWYIAVSLAPISDVTAILNTNAFWAYGLSVWMTGSQWQTRRLLAVVIAILGVFMIVYGGAVGTVPPKGGTPVSTHPILGDMMTLAASIAYSIYQVSYKRWIALPTTGIGASTSAGYEPIQGTDVGEEVIPSISGSTRPFRVAEDDRPVYPPFGLHPNAITSCLGATTLLFLWPMLVVANYTGIEAFRLPPDMRTWMFVAGMALCGVAYNAGFMVLLALWGPVLSTVGNLLTIVLVLISDSLFGHARETVTPASLLGAFSIVSAFAVLVSEERKVLGKAGRADERIHAPYNNAP